MTRVSIKVDGVDYEDDVEPRTLLVHHLREQLGKVGTVVGCDTSNCGACTVLMSDADGQQQGVKSCAVLAVQADGREITTIEGLSGPDNTLHPVQRAFHEAHAPAVRLLHPRHDHGRGRPARGEPRPDRGGDPRRAWRATSAGAPATRTSCARCARRARRSARGGGDRRAGAHRRRSPARARRPTPACRARACPTRPSRSRCREGEPMTITEGPGAPRSAAPGGARKTPG